MKIDLIHFTGKGTSDETWYAARLLAFSKNTHLQMNLGGFNSWLNVPLEVVVSELEGMLTEIPRSWEFVDVTFSVNDITQVCAQRLIRTHPDHYEIQPQRLMDMSEVGFLIPDSVPENLKMRYRLMINTSIDGYRVLVKDGVSLEDARGVLPMNAYCSLILKYSLYNLIGVIHPQPKMKGEYQEVIKNMATEVLIVWPWLNNFLDQKPEIKSRHERESDLIKKESS